MSAGDFLEHPLLSELGVAHGFGLRDSPPRPDVLRPRQVHGIAVARVRGGDERPGEADAIVATAPGVAVGVLTADCVPVLLVAGGGEAVAAVHAGWRGVAAGVVPAALEALATAGGGPLRAVVGPHIGPCCYEVDAPVLDALRPRFGARLDAALRPTRSGHARVDLGHLVRVQLASGGLGPEAIGTLPQPCTHCDAVRYHSYRRDGERAGRLVHWIRSASTCGVDTSLRSP